MATRLIMAAAALAAIASPAMASENRVLKCNIWAARHGEASSGPALVANVPRAMTPIDLNAVQFEDKKLAKRVIVEGLFAERTPTDTLHVMARVVNCKKYPITIQLRSSFMDQNQMPLEASSMWKSVYLSPFGTAVYEERSISGPKVANYLIELRAPQ